MDMENLFYSLADLLLKGVAIMTLASAMSVLFRRSSAARQDVIWSFAFVALLLLPFALLLPPQWSWMPTGDAVAQESAHGARESIVLFVPQSSADLAPAGRTIPLVLPDGNVALLAVWLVGLAALLLRRAAGSFQIWRLARSSVTPPPRIAQLSREAALHFGLRRAAVLQLSPTIHVPLTWGTWRPVITLPVESVYWSEERLLIALRHEYAHIRRHDALTRLIAQLACAIHWLNPLAWLAAKKLRLLQEQAADDLVLASGVDPVVYADELVQTVRRLQTSAVFQPALAMAQPGTLEERVLAVLDETRIRKGGNRAIVAAGAATAALSLAASAVAQVSPAKPDERSGPTGSAGAPPASSAAPDASANNWIDLNIMPASGIYEGFLRYDWKGFIPVGAPVGAPISTLDHVFSTNFTKRPPEPIPEEEFGKTPITIDAEEVRYEDGIPRAEGAAKLVYRAAVITADLLQYHPTTKTVFAWGKVEIIAQNGARTAGEAAIVEYNLLTDEAKYIGPYRPTPNSVGGPYRPFINQPPSPAQLRDRVVPEKQKARPLPVAPR